jgi:P-type Mg2+ transporter
VKLSTSKDKDGKTSALPAQLGFVNSLMQKGTKSPIDRAIVEYVNDGRKEFDEVRGEERWILHGEVPFESNRKMLSVLVSCAGECEGKGEFNNEGLLITKGAVDEVLERCISVINSVELGNVYRSPYLFNSKGSPGRSTPLDPSLRQHIQSVAERMNEEGYRLVAVAYRTTLIKPFMRISTDDEEDLTFVGFLCFMDPLKPDAAKAIKDLADLSVQVHVTTCIEKTFTELMQ